MNFTAVFIKRPVLATVLSLIILLIGLQSYFNLQVNLYPKIDTSVITISTVYPGADTELMEGFVTTPIENALGGVDGIDYISSSSAMGISNITIYFQLGYDIDTASADVSAKVNSVRWKLPQDINDPVISKLDPNATPTIYMNFSSRTLTQEQISDYLERIVQPQLQTLSGVGTAEIWGPSYAMRIWLNPQLMSAYSVTASDIIQKLVTENTQSPAGQLKSIWQKFDVKTFSEATNAEQFNNLALRSVNDRLIRIKDIGYAELGAQSSDIAVNVNGQPSVVVAITPASNANPLDITHEVNKIFPQLIKTLPSGLSATIMWDSSKFIAESINEVKITIIEATLCVILVVFLFIGSWRTLLVPIVTIPLSLIGVCGIMYVMGYSLNTITFLSMVLAIGIVVDDAIVVAENIHRHISLGKAPLQAAILGTEEIQFAIVAMTFTLAAVYAPIGFLGGLLGAIFKEFAFSLAGAVIISGIIALTLSPMMCSKMMSSEHKESKFTETIDEFYTKITDRYRLFLTKVIERKKFILLLVPFILFGSALLYIAIPSELAPKEDTGFISVPAMAPTSANIDYTVKYTNQLEKIYKEIPEHENYLIINGSRQSPNIAFSGIILKPWSKRDRSVDEIIAEISPKIWSIPGIIAYPINPSNLPGSSGGKAPIQLVLQTIGDYQKLYNIAEKVVNEASKNTSIVNFDINPKLDQPQLGIKINRNKAGDLGVSVQDIGNAINLGLGQPTISRFSILGRSYDVIPQMIPEYSNRPDTLNNLYLRTSSGDAVSLSNLITIDETVQPQSIDHFQQLRSITISANTVSGYTLGQAIKYLEKVCQKIVPSDIQKDYSDESRQYIQTGNQMLVTFVFAIIFIFLILSAQFESFRDPLIVLCSIPLSTFGALFTMYITGCTMNIYSEIGLVTLIGLISKHGILMIEFANHLQEKGKNIKDAIITASSVRLRPILMTTFAMALGSVPLALASGAGAISRRQIGWVIVGGMSIGTIFTLFVIPAIYVYLATKKQNVEVLNS